MFSNTMFVSTMSHYCTAHDAAAAATTSTTLLSLLVALTQTTQQLSSLFTCWSGVVTARWSTLGLVSTVTIKMMSPSDSANLLLLIAGMD